MIAQVTFAIDISIFLVINLISRRAGRNSARSRESERPWTRLSLLTFPQRYDGATPPPAHPGGAAARDGVERRPAAAADRGRAGRGRHADPFADADLQLEARVLKGSTVSRQHALADFIAPAARTRAAWWPTRAPLFESLVAPLPGPLQALRRRCRSWPGLPAERFAISKYLPRSYRDVVRVHRAARRRVRSPTTAITARSRRTRSPIRRSWHRRTP